MNSREYWKQREDEALKHYIKEEAEYDKQIKRIYEDMLDACQKEIDAFYGRYAKAENISLAEAKKRVSELDIKRYERKAEKYVKEREFSKQANEEMRLYNATMKINRLEMLKANIGLELIKGHDELEKFMGEVLKGRTMDELKRQAGILGKTVRNNAKLAHTIPNASFHNATFSDRIWQYQNMMKADISKLLQQGMIQGKNPRVLAKELRKYYIGDQKLKNGKNGAIYNTERLMRTELSRVRTEAQKASILENGFSEYIVIPLGKCCDMCKPYRDKHYKVEDMEIAENAPPFHPNCRCAIAAYDDDEEYEAWLEFLDKGGTTAEWNSGAKDKWAKGASIAEILKGNSGSFKKAESIEEAEEYIKQFVDEKGFGALGVSYKGIDVEVANAINRTFANIYGVFDVGKFGGIIAPAGNTKLGKMIEGATAGYSPVRNSFLLNRKSLKNMKTVMKTLEGETGTMKNILEHPERYDFTKISKRVLKVVERAKVSGRATVPASIEDVLHHEIGHMLEKQVYKSPEWEIAQANMSKYADKISGYAGESKGEYIAESFASYMKGENVADPVLIGIFESLKR